MKVPGSKSSHVNRITKKMKRLLEFWMLENDKEAAFEYFMRQNPDVRFLLLKGLKEVIALEKTEEFAKAGREIPEYIKSKL